jgi:hypothetical protein
MPFVRVKQIWMGVEVKDTERPIYGTIEGLHQGNGHRMVTAQEQGHWVLENLSRPAFHFVKVAWPL